jgi:hypothetical protein
MALDISRKILGNIDGGSNFAQYGFPVANGVTVTAGDFVYFTSGRISSATITGDARPIGMVTETATGNSAGTVVANVAVDDDLRYLLQNDNIGTTFAATHVGQYFDLIGATGAQLVDTSTVSTTTGLLLCLEYNPQIDPVKTDLTYGVFVLVESATDPLGS